MTWAQRTARYGITPETFQAALAKVVARPTIRKADFSDLDSLTNDVWTIIGLARQNKGCFETMAIEGMIDDE